MSKNEDSSSSSDDEVVTEALREACDDKFLPQSLFSKDFTKLSENEPEIKEESKPSLRIAERSNNFENFGVSQSFKDHVAKKLDAMLERTIKIQNTENCECKVPKKKKKINNLEAGIKLLSSSKKPMIAVEEPIVETQSRSIKPWKFSKESEATNIAKCQEVAVDPHSILSKTETKAWNERQKDNVFKYKKSWDGTLIEQQ